MTLLWTEINGALYYTRQGPPNLSRQGPPNDPAGARTFRISTKKWGVSGLGKVRHLEMFTRDGGWVSVDHAWTAADGGYNSHHGEGKAIVAAVEADRLLESVLNNLAR